LSIFPSLQSLSGEAIVDCARRPTNNSVTPLDANRRTRFAVLGLEDAYVLNVLFSFMTQFTWLQGQMRQADNIKGLSPRIIQFLVFIALGCWWTTPDGDSRILVTQFLYVTVENVRCTNQEIRYDF